uniref:Putative secreted protein n=1 Tax=Ixodes ricinus TaxID=34613 RepID=A0A6B0U2G1_IXORI
MRSKFHVCSTFFLLVLWRRFAWPLFRRVTVRMTIDVQSFSIHYLVYGNWRAINPVFFFSFCNCLIHPFCLLHLRCVTSHTRLEAHGI